MALDRDQKIELFATAPIPKTILNLAIPTVLSQLISIIYNLADSFFVGRIGDPYQIAALALTFPFFMLSHLIGNLFGIGGNSVIARALGKGEYERIKRVSEFSLLGAILASVLLMLITIFFLEDLLIFVGASPETLQYARDYLFYTLTIGAIPVCCQLTLAHLIRAEGASRQAGIGVMLGGILNIILDPILIFKFDMGIAGAAIATLASNVTSLIYFMIYLIRNRETSFLSFRLQIPAWAEAKKVMLNGLPACFTIVFGIVTNAIMTRCASEFSDLAVASFGILQKFTTSAIFLAVGFGQGVMPILGFNYAAKNEARIRKINRFAITSISILAVVAISLTELFPETLVSFFSTDPETVSAASRFVQLAYPGVFGTLIINYYASAWQGFGKWRLGLGFQAMRQLLIYGPSIVWMSRLWGVDGLSFSFLISELATFVIGTFMFIFVLRTIYRSFHADSAAQLSKDI